MHAGWKILALQLMTSLSYLVPITDLTSTFNLLSWDTVNTLFLLLTLTLEVVRGLRTQVEDVQMFLRATQTVILECPAAVSELSHTTSSRTTHKTPLFAYYNLL